MNMRRGVLNTLFAFVSIVGAAFASAASAQNYPTRPIQMIVPFPPGGIADSSARIVAASLSSALGQPIIIENRGGSGGNIGVDIAARATPDGYTLLMTPNSPLTMNPFMFKAYPINPTRDVVPITMVGEGYIGLVVLASSPFHSVKDVIEAAKAKPGELTFGNIGVGSSHYVAGALLNKKANIETISIPFQGGGPALQSLLGGHISMSYTTLSAAIPYVNAGKMRLVAVVENKRLAQFPDVPTIAETVPGVTTSTWMGLFAPRGTPQPIIDKLNQVTTKVLGSSEVLEKLASVGILAKASTPEELGKTVQEDLDFWREAIATAGLGPK